VPSLKHNYISARPQSADSNLVSKNAWNDEHNFQVEAFSVLGRSGSTAGSVQAISAASDNLTLQRIAGALVFAIISTTALADNSVTYAKLQDVAALSVVGQPTNVAGDAVDITAGADFNILRRSGTAIGFGSIDLSQAGAVGSSRLAYANVAQGSARSVWGVGGNATADHADIQGTADQVLVVNTAGTALAFGTVATGGITAAAVTYAKIQNLAGLSVMGRSASSSGVGADITGTANQFLQVNSGATALAFVTMGGDAALSSGTLTVQPQAITFAKIQNSAAAGLSVVGRSTNSAGSFAEINAASDFQVLRRSGTAVGFGAIDVSQANAVTGRLAFANLTQGSARSVLGVTGNATADFASIQGTADQVLRVDSAGTSLAFGTIATAGIANNAVDNTKIRQGIARSVIGVTGNATANVADIQGAAGSILNVPNAGTSLIFSTSPEIATQVTVPIVIGGTGASSSLSIKSTSGVGTSDFIDFLVGNNGAVRAMRMFTTGQVSVGDTATAAASNIAINSGGTLPNFQTHTTTTQQCMAYYQWSNDTLSAQFNFAKSRSGTVGTHTIVASGDDVGILLARGSDGTNFIQAAGIRFQIDGTPGTNDMPGRIVFSTTLDGASGITNRWQIGNDGFLTMLSGSFGRGAVVTKTADFTLAANENWVINNKAGATCTVTLPAGSAYPGREVMFQNNQAQTLVSASSNVVPKASTTAGTAILPATNGAWCTLVSDGTNWKIMISGT
jgi:hypothetical protein